MTNPAERLNYSQDSSSDTETDYKETDPREQQRLYQNRLSNNAILTYLIYGTSEVFPTM